MKFRDLKADEIECRVQSLKEKGLVLLLYKDARCDMNVLDETVGAMNWQRSHTRENANCIVSIWDENKKQWVSKEDTGTESNTEAKKGLASDSFKRACFNWGIGRELYTAPFIWVSNGNCTIEKKVKNNKEYLVCNDTFTVADITIENKQITALKIWNDKQSCIAFEWQKTQNNGNSTAKENKPKEQPEPKTEQQDYYCEKCGKPFEDVLHNGKIHTAKAQYNSAIKHRGGAYCKPCYDAMKVK